MIVFLTVMWCVLLLIAVKTKMIKLTLWWKLSPIIWMAFLLIVLFIPMQFWAPAGNAVVMQYSVAIVPNVGGQVQKVHVEPNEPLKKGDLLYELDPTKYQAQYNQVKAQLALARVRLKQTEDLASQDAVSGYELEQYQAQVAQLEAGLQAAEYDLNQTKIVAPSDGFVTNVGLRAGARVSFLAFAHSMTFVEDSERFIAAQIPQAYLRFVEAGQQVEITLKALPGKIYSGEVESVVMASAMGQVAASGKMPTPRDIQPVPFVVRLKMDDYDFMNTLPAGAVGSVAIYTGEGKATHVIRKVMIRMDAYMNFIDPT